MNMKKNLIEYLVRSDFQISKSFIFGTTNIKCYKYLRERFKSDVNANMYKNTIFLQNTTIFTYLFIVDKILL